MTDRPKEPTLREAAEAVVRQLTQEPYRWKVSLSPPVFCALEELRDALRHDEELRAEIVAVLRMAGDCDEHCPVCGCGRLDVEHFPDCRLAALLARLEKR